MVGQRTWGPKNEHVYLDLFPGRCVANEIAKPKVFINSDISSTDTECVSKVISVLKRGKASDIDGLTSEHILFSHPVLPVIITRLFQLILLTQHIPSGFKYSYIVPISKLKDTRTKTISCDDFRGVAITPILSKL